VLYPAHKAGYIFYTRPPAIGSTHYLFLVAGHIHSAAPHFRFSLPFKSHIKESNRGAGAGDTNRRRHANKGEGEPDQPGRRNDRAKKQHQVSYLYISFISFFFYVIKDKREKVC
jgi:hypothetical protein